MKIIKIISFLTTIVCTFVLFSFFALANAQAEKERVFDKGGYISTYDKAKLEQKLSKAEENSGVSFRVYIDESPSYFGGTTVSHYESKMGERFENLVLLVITHEQGEYYYELFTKGNPDTLITDREVDKILDNDDVYDNIKNGKLYEGIDAYVSLSERAVTGTVRNSFVSVIIPTAIISLAVATVISVCVFMSYRKKLHSASYPLDRYARLDLNVSDDVFINKSLTRVRVNNSSGSSGSGGGISFGGGSRGRR